MDLIDAEFTEHPFTGVERMVDFLGRQHGLVVNHKRVRRLMRKMGLMAIYATTVMLFRRCPPRWLATCGEKLD